MKQIQVLDCNVIVDVDDYEFCRLLGLTIVRRAQLKHVIINVQPFYKQYLHRVLLGVTDPKVIVDHINGNGLDNRRCNLRITNKVGNALNMSVNKNKKSGLPKGVYKKRDKYRACIQINGLNKALGVFKTVEEAQAAYQAELNKYWASND